MMADLPTAPNLRVLQQAAEHEHGVARHHVANGLAATNWRRMMSRMILAGWLRPSPHGRDEAYITDAGRAALAKASGATP